MVGMVGSTLREEGSWADGYEPQSHRGHRDAQRRW